VSAKWGFEFTIFSHRRSAAAKIAALLSIEVLIRSPDKYKDDQFAT